MFYCTLNNTLFFILIAVLSTQLSAQSPALNFDGVNDFVETSFEGLPGNTDRSIEAWIKTTANCIPTDGGHQIVIVDFGTFVNTQRFTFNVLWGNAIRIEIGGGGVNGGIAVNDGNWHHVAAVYVAQSNTVRLYVDGILDVEGVLPLTPNTVTVNTNLVIGKRVDNINFFNGDIDEVRMYDYALTAEEITNNMSSELCSTMPGLVGYWKFNEGAPGQNNAGFVAAKDYSGNQYDGILNDFALMGDVSNWTSGTVQATSSTETSITVLECESYTSPSGNETWTESGNYVEIITNAAGCDSTINIDLTIIQPSDIDTSITLTGTTLSVGEMNANYTWINCATGLPILGATSNSFTVQENGEYAVIIEQGGCEATSACVPVMIVGTSQPVLSERAKIFPNPNQGTFKVELDEQLVATSYLIYDSFGRVLAKELLENRSSFIVQQNELSCGVYFMRIETTEGVILQRYTVLK